MPRSAPWLFVLSRLLIVAHATRMLYSFEDHPREQYFKSDGTYSFAYDTGDVEGSFRGESRDASGVVRGYYGHVDSNGALWMSEYVADHRGYRVRTTVRSMRWTVTSHALRFMLMAALGNASSGVDRGNEVIEEPFEAHVVRHDVSDEATIVKLKCNILKDAFRRNRAMSVNEMRWEHKKCGYGLRLTDCAESDDVEWLPVMCKNGSKFCDGYSIKLESPTSSDSGYYRCLYKNYMSKRFKVYKVFRVDVHDPDESMEILEEPYDYDNRVVHVHDTATFRCRARSLSPLYMVWTRLAPPGHRGHGSISYGDRSYVLVGNEGAHNIGNGLYISKLTLHDCRIDDGGYYYCIVIGVNHARSLKNKTVSLTVVPRPRNEGIGNAISPHVAIAFGFSLTRFISR